MEGRNVATIQVSPNWIRQQLRQTFSEILNMLPQGDDSTITIDVMTDGTSAHDRYSMAEDIMFAFCTVAQVNEAELKDFPSQLETGGLQAILSDDGP